MALHYRAYYFFHHTMDRSSCCFFCCFVYCLLIKDTKRQAKHWNRICVVTYHKWSSYNHTIIQSFNHSLITNGAIQCHFWQSSTPLCLLILSFQHAILLVDHSAHGNVASEFGSLVMRPEAAVTSVCTLLGSTAGTRAGAGGGRVRLAR